MNRVTILRAREDESFSEMSRVAEKHLSELHITQIPPLQLPGAMGLGALVCELHPATGYRT